MNFILFFQNYKFVLLFYAVIILIVFLNRKKFQFQGKIIALYRTKVGLGLMDRIAEKHRNLVQLLGFCSVGVAYVGLIYVFFLLIKLVFDLIIEKPGAVGASPVLPGLPIAGTGLVFPLIIGWISLFIIIVVHEFSHGVVARSFKLPVLHSGIVFFGPILGAFVEPDEKKLVKRPDIEQYSIFSAGPVSNIVLALIAFAILGFVLTPAITSVSQPIGVQIGIQPDLAAAQAAIPAGSIVIAINNQEVSDFDSFFAASKQIKSNEEVSITTQENTYILTTTEHPEEPTKGYMGVTLQKEITQPKQGLSIPYAIFKWLIELFFWLSFISLNIGLINLFPIFITDGARILKVSIDSIVKNKQKAFILWKNINVLAIFIILILLLLPLFRNIFSLL